VIGVLILSHYRLADEFIAALRHIVGEVPHVRAIGLDPAATAPEEMRAQIDKAIREVDQGKGVLVLVDMFGGTPSNLSLAFLEEGRVEVVTGVNLPMLVDFVFNRTLSAEEAANRAVARGGDAIRQR